MIGVFDSGAGGVSALLKLRRLLPREDMIFLADRKNAPYGTKTKGELLGLMRRNISRLSEMGARRILIACCTASALWSELSAWEREITLPIIDLTVESIPESGKRVAVIATEYTVSSHAFGKAIKKLRPDIRVAELPMQSLVRKVEIHRQDQGKSRLEKIINPELEDIDRLVKNHSPDSLILGCTHFSWVESILEKRYPSVTVLNPAELGAMRLACELSDSNEQGRTVYTE